MYREYVLSTNPYSYWPLDQVHGIADILGRSGDFVGADVPVATGTAPKLYQPLVPGFHSAKTPGAESALGRPFGCADNEKIPFTIDGWFELFPNNDYADYGARDFFYLGTDNTVGFLASNMYVSFGGVGKDHIKIADPDQTHYVAVTWTGSVLSTYVDGILASTIEAPAGFAFTNTDTALVLDATFSSNVAVYDRALTQAEILQKYLQAKPISHSDSCANDNGDVFRMYVTGESFYDIDIDAEFNSSESKNIIVDEDGYYTTREVPPLAYIAAPDFVAGGAEIGAGEYLYLSALGNIGSDQFVIGIKTDADDTRAADEYLFSLIGDRQRVSAYVTTTNILKIDIINVDETGAETTQTITFDDAVTTVGSEFVFIYASGYLSVKSDATPLDLNPSGGNEYIEAQLIIDQSTILVIGADDVYGGSAVPRVSDLITYDTTLSLDQLLNDYSNYFDPVYAKGYWPMETDWTVNGYNSTYLYAEILMPNDEEILNAYAISDGGLGMTPEIVTSNSTVQIRRYIDPVTSIPFTTTPGTEIDQAIEVVVPSTPTAPALAFADYYNGISFVKIRSYTDRIVRAENSESSITFTGDGNVWIASDASNRFSRNKYDGIFFDSGSVRGPIYNPNVDGTTISYEYRAVEFLLYIDFDTVNSGRIFSINDGGTERYLSINKAGNSLTHNLSSVTINNVNMSGKNITNYYNQWIHVYCQFATKIEDQQLYIGGGYNAANYVNGIGLQNLATYTDPLTAANITEHYQAFLGRYRLIPDQNDTLVIDQVAAPSLYAPAWHTNVIPV